MRAGAGGVAGTGWLPRQATVKSPSARQSFLIARLIVRFRLPTGDLGVACVDERRPAPASAPQRVSRFIAVRDSVPVQTRTSWARVRTLALANSCCRVALYWNSRKYVHPRRVSLYSPGPGRVAPTPRLPGWSTRVNGFAVMAVACGWILTAAAAVCNSVTSAMIAASLSFSFLVSGETRRPPEKPHPNRDDLHIASSCPK